MQRVWRTVTGFYHVCARGTGKQLIFEGDEDRWEFLELMRECCREEGVTVIAWCLMGNHVHLVLADYEDRMSAAMHRLLFDVRAAVQQAHGAHRSSVPKPF